MRLSLKRKAHTRLCPVLCGRKSRYVLVQRRAETGGMTVFARKMSKTAGGINPNCPTVFSINGELPQSPSLLTTNDGCPTSRSFFARCGISRIETLSVDSEPNAFGLSAVVSHISRKTSEMWGTRHLLSGYRRKGSASRSGALRFLPSSRRNARAPNQPSIITVAIARPDVCVRESEMLFTPSSVASTAARPRSSRTGPPSRLARNLKLNPRDPPADASSQCFGSRLFGRETRGETLRTASLAAAIGDLMICVNTAQKALAVAFDGMRDALDLNQIHARPDQHADHITMGSFPVISIANRGTCSAVEDCDNVADQLSKQGIFEVREP